MRSACARSERRATIPPMTHKDQKTERRSPVIVVMGHIDHGKTTLLDRIRSASVAKKEAGGITQSIGAYEIVHPPVDGRRLTFIDTPGHEAFSKMRSRGAKVADLGILVVAADDGVMPQTQEAINALREAHTPFVVAINKIDKSNADVEKTKQSLLHVGVFLEGYGGDVSFQPISATTGQGVDELLDLVMLASDMLDLRYDAASPARGVVIETRMNRQRGIEASLIVKDGTLKAAEEIRTQSSRGKIKILENFAGAKADKLVPSSPALVVGFETVPETGEEFVAGASLDKAALPSVKSEILSMKAKESQFRVILKADVAGSLEALEGAIGRVLPEVGIVQKGLGDITDSDAKIAVSTGAKLVGFRVKVAKSAEALIKAHRVSVISSAIIYELIDLVKEEFEHIMRGLKEPVAVLEVLALFKSDGGTQVVGGRVAKGTVKSHAPFRIMRRGSIAGEGTILNLQKEKKDATEASEGEECGMLVKSGAPIKAQDELAFDE